MAGYWKIALHFSQPVEIHHAKFGYFFFNVGTLKGIKVV